MTTHVHNPHEIANPLMINDIARSMSMNIIQEALSRARMRSPQTANSEARSSARHIAMHARRQQAREIGNLSQYGVR